MEKNTELVTAQYSLDLQIAAEKEVNGIGMGVLSNGTPFLTVRGLSRMCGVNHAAIVRLTAQWQDEPQKPREQRIRSIIRENGGNDSIVFIAVPKDGTIHHAIPDIVCMAVLEYYAFEAEGVSRDHALRSYRILARKGFSDFIYSQVGYDPAGSANAVWRQFHDRVSLSYHTVPDGYFSVFREIADLIVTLIRGGAHLGPTFVPDISVGMHWGKKWAAENLDAVYGMRMKYEHNYPEYFPQSPSNPQPAFCYPDDALAEFRSWVREIYLQKHISNYMANKVKDGAIPGPKAQKAIAALTMRNKNKAIG